MHGRLVAVGIGLASMLALGAGAVMQGCYSAPEPTCGFLCGANPPCPEDYQQLMIPSADGNGQVCRCVLPGTTAQMCFLVDAGGGLDQAPPIDGMVDGLPDVSVEIDAAIDAPVVIDSMVDAVIPDSMVDAGVVPDAMVDAEIPDAAIDAFVMPDAAIDAFVMPDAPDVPDAAVDAAVTPDAADDAAIPSD